MTLFACGRFMMIGMMTPSVAPRSSSIPRSPAARPVRDLRLRALVRGRLSPGLDGLLAARNVHAVGLEQLALVSALMTSTSGIFGGLLLIVAGVYQWLPLKYSCLSRCRAPLSFIMEHGGFQQQAAGSLRLECSMACTASAAAGR